MNGALDSRHVVPVVGRAWNFVPLGHGLSRRGWLEILQALREAGYDDVISIENEDYTLDTKVAVARSVTQKSRRRLATAPPIQVRECL